MGSRACSGTGLPGFLRVRGCWNWWIWRELGWTKVQRINGGELWEGQTPDSGKASGTFIKYSFPVHCQKGMTAEMEIICPCLLWDPKPPIYRFTTGRKKQSVLCFHSVLPPPQHENKKFCCFWKGCFGAQSAKGQGPLFEDLIPFWVAQQRSLLTAKITVTPKNIGFSKTANIRD